MAELEVIGPEDRLFATSTSLFNRLNGRSSDQLLRHAHVRGYSKGEFIFRTGEDPQFAYVVLSGCVALTGHSDEGRNTVVEFLEPGECFALAPVALDKPYLLSARAATEIRLLHIEAERVRALIQSNHEFSISMVEILSHHWRQLVEQITDLKLKSSAQRLGGYLLTLAKGPSSSDVRLPSERQLVAARLGMTPESLSRAFARLRQLGVIGHGQTVVVKDAKRLRAFCEGRDQS
ncbi:MAG TPA: cyclic nucleotide-binding domain-containing protein [Alphaproteobacteria bacterium]